ncbi:MAG TPA: D-alanyl-D-alanine carboxypeptidase family protein [Novosphingobium sp.]
MNIKRVAQGAALLVAGALLPLAQAPAADTAPPPPAEIAPIPVVMLTDLGSGQVLYARQPDLSFVPASVTKVMTAYVAFEAMAAGRLRPTTLFPVRRETALQWRGVGTSLALDPGAHVPVEILLRGVTTVSANDAAVVLAEGFAGSVSGWSALMNAEARRLGMTHSRFATPNGWPDEGATYVSASDLTKLANAMIRRHPSLYRSYFGQKTLTWNGVTGRNHDPISGVVPGADGIKTGYTREAGYNFLGSAERDGRRLVMVLAGAHNGPERAAAARALIDWGFAAWDARKLFAAGEAVGEALVQGGDYRRVPLVAPSAIDVATPRGSGGAVRLRVIYKGPLKAPIASGSQVAELEIVPAVGPPGRVPLFAGHGVAQAGPIDRLINGLAALFT